MAIPVLQPRQEEPKNALVQGLPLRIMPLGASITFGTRSSDGNGYRKYLRDRITALGNPVNMVGNHPNGTMNDNENEGWPGFVITQVQAKADESVPISKPNVILINAGTNDCIQNIDTPNAGVRMTSMVNRLFTQSPEATVVLSTLIPNRDAAVESRTLDVNKQYVKVVSDLAAQGKRVVLADMRGPAGPTIDDIVDDGTHPSDAGYKKMAMVWMNALVQAALDGKLQPAEAVEGLPDNGPA